MNDKHNKEALIKKVQRINLCYEFEELKGHLARVKKAQEKRKVHEALVRYTGRLLNGSTSQQQEVLIKEGVIQRVVHMTCGAKKLKEIEKSK